MPGQITQSSVPSNYDLAINPDAVKHHQAKKHKHFVFKSQVTRFEPEYEDDIVREAGWDDRAGVVYSKQNHQSHKNFREYFSKAKALKDDGGWSQSRMIPSDLTDFKPDVLPDASLKVQAQEQRRVHKVQAGVKHYVFRSDHHGQAAKRSSKPDILATEVGWNPRFQVCKALGDIKAHVSRREYFTTPKEFDEHTPIRAVVNMDAHKQLVLVNNAAPENEDTREPKEEPKKQPEPVYGYPHTNKGWDTRFGVRRWEHPKETAAKDRALFLPTRPVESKSNQSPRKRKQNKLKKTRVKPIKLRITAAPAPRRPKLPLLF